MLDNNKIKIKAALISINQDVEEACFRLRKGVESYQKDSLDAFDRQVLLMHCLASGYTSLESAIKRIMKLVGEDLPSGSSWHVELIQQAGMDLEDIRSPIFSEEVINHLYNLRGFRHVAFHNYSNFSATLAQPAIDSATYIAQSLKGHIDEFMKKMGWSEDHVKDDNVSDKGKWDTP